MGDIGLEQGAILSGKTSSSGEDGAESGALFVSAISHDSSLAAVVAAWPKLPTTAKACVLAIIEANC
jgi:hypothetical protein